MAEILMPELGENVREGTITRWTKRVGESVTNDDVLFEVSTDKVDSEVLSQATGVLSEILVPAGETVPVGTCLAIVSDQIAVVPTPIDALPRNDRTVDPIIRTLSPDLASSSTWDEQLEKRYARGLTYSPMVRRMIEESNVDPMTINGTGPGGRIKRSDVLQAIQSHSSGGIHGIETTHGLRRNHSPVVRRLLINFGLDPTTIIGTGAGGRITRSDVLTAASLTKTNLPGTVSRWVQPPAAAFAEDSRGGRRDSTSSVVPPPTSPVAPGVDNDDEILPFTNIRRRTAEHMIRSKSTSAHTTVAIEVDFFNVERVRAKWKEKFRATEGFGLTYLPFAARAAIDAIRQFPHVNSTVGDDALIIHHQINVGVAVDLNFDGLLVPVVKRADALRLPALAREISVLSGKARTRKLSTDDLSGGTFTITNAGPFGTLFTVPVINQPQVAILSTDGVKKKPVAIELVDGGDAIAVHPVGNLAMSWDHRAFDGAYAAAFLRSIKDILETRDWAAEF